MWDEIFAGVSFSRLLIFCVSQKQIFVNLDIRLFSLKVLLAGNKFSQISGKFLSCISRTTVLVYSTARGIQF